MRVVCTAGHVDHGKSALVKALTGTHPDRFAEERARGLTIDLGFAWTELTTPDAEPVTVAFVDLPGHERFIGNMLAGAGGVDIALLVVAADEGWMPQSAEHLAVLDLLGVRHGLVAVTKVDLVDEETAELGVELVREELADSSLAGAEIVPVSASSGQGMAALAASLHELLAHIPAPPETGRPRLWVDRAFTVSGAGTVATGTLQGGSLRAGDSLVVLPEGARARVRGLQQLGKSVTDASPGSRVAVNLAGIDVEQVPRGAALGLPGQWHPSQALEARVRTLPDAVIGRRGAWKLYAGSGVWNARVAPLANRPVGGGDSGDIRIALDAPAPLVAGDRFVLRDTGRQSTAGGGVVLDADPPPRPRGSGARTARIRCLADRREAIEVGDQGRLLALHVRERRITDTARAVAVSGLDTQRADAAKKAHGLVVVRDMLADDDAIGAWGRVVLDVLRAHHARAPVERAARRDVPARALVEAGCPRELTVTILDLLVARGDVVAEGPGLRAPEHRPMLDEETEAARASLLSTLSETPFQPPKLDTAAEHSRASPTLVREMEAAGELIRLSADLAVPPATLDAAHARLSEVYDQEGPLSAARAKEALETSRRVALPLLEEMDRRRLTRRIGDEREVLPRE